MRPRSGAPSPPQPAAPSCSNALERLLDRVARRSLLPGPPLHHAEGEQRAGTAERITHLVVPSLPPASNSHGRLSTWPRAAATRPRIGRLRERPVDDSAARASASQGSRAARASSIRPSSSNASDVVDAAGQGQARRKPADGRAHRISRTGRAAPRARSRARRWPSHSRASSQRTGRPDASASSMPRSRSRARAQLAPVRLHESRAAIRCFGDLPSSTRASRRLSDSLLRVRASGRL